jgi:2-keto-4-pentenoate hydratase/2-oxohepta-3-ene-1,7-dioic acid hydratase in catechol pathway
MMVMPPTRRLARVLSAGQVVWGLLNDGQDAIAPSAQHRDSQDPQPQPGPAVAVERLLCPVVPSKVLGLGYNYRKPGAPAPGGAPRLVHLKPPGAIIGPGDPIILPRLSSWVVPEPEVGVVIGRRARDVPATDVDAYVLGLTCLNDVTAWDLLKSSGDMAAAKVFDTFCPIGPFVAAGADLDTQRRVWCRVNGRVTHQATTADQCHSIRETVSYLSAACTLLPGDVVGMGSPMPLDEVRLKDGDEVCIEIEGVGTLCNPVKA